LCESDGPFFVRDQRAVLRVERTPEGATLRVTLIDTPTEFTAPHAIPFGLIATPVRPKTWRTPEHLTYRGHPTDHGGGAAGYPAGHECVPAADTGQGPHEYSCLYVFASVINPRVDAAGTDDFRYFGDEWLKNAKIRLAPGEWAHTTQASRSFRDWFVWRYWRYQQKYGFGGLYYDGSAEIESSNPYAAPPYRKRDGSTAAVIPLLATRDLYQRLYHIVLSNPNIAARDTWVGLHHSGLPNMAYLGFGTHSWDGENFNSIINAQQPTYRGVVDPALFRAQLMGHNFGWPVMFLGQGRIKRPWVEAHGGAEGVYDQFTGLVLLHDAMLPKHEPCCIVHDGSEISRVGDRLHEAINRHLFYHWAFQFVPYWKQTIVTLPQEEMYASWYIAQPSRLQPVVNPWNTDAQALDGYFDPHLPQDIKVSNRRTFVGTTGAMTMQGLPPHKAVLIVYNNSAWEGEMRLKPDWAKLGFASPDGLVVENAVHSTGFRLEQVKDTDGKEVEKAAFINRPEEYAKIENGELVFPMTAWNYRMIVIEQR
jgi:hypothetical protein